MGQFTWMYGRRWTRARLSFLVEHPLCAMCLESGRVVAASVVDHKTPHKGDAELFWDEGNWQSLCQPHHDSSKQRAEKRGVSSIGCDANGVPLDENHHWNTIDGGDGAVKKSKLG